MKIFFPIGGLTLALVCLTGCQIPNWSNAPRFEPRPPGEFSNVAAGLALSRELDPTLLQPSLELFTLGPGDAVQIEIIDQAGSRADATVGPDGKIYFGLLPGMDVWGLTLAGAKRLLEQQLDQYQAGAQVSLTLRAVGSKHVWLLGSVNSPGIYPIAAPATLLEALALAGGTRRAASGLTTVEIADLRHAFVIRDGTNLPVDFHRLLEQGDMSQNIYLQADDFVYVPSGAAREIYLFGAVRNPRAMALSEHPTLLSAITAAGGPTRDAFISQVAIVRGSLTAPEVAIVNYGDILNGQAGDVPLAPRDIVFVPNSPYRFLRNYVDTILNTFVFTVAANEGANAFDGNRVGVSVPVGN